MPLPRLAADVVPVSAVQGGLLPLALLLLQRRRGILG